MKYKVLSISFLVFVQLLISSQGRIYRATPGNGTISLEGVLNGTYGIGGYNGKWTSDDDVIEYRDADGNIHEKNVRTGDDDILLYASLFDSFPDDKSFSFSPDRNFVLVKYNVVSKWRYSNNADYSIFNVATNVSTRVLPVTEPTEGIALFQWSPVPSSTPNAGHGFSVVYKNNIYYQSSAIESEETPLIPVTTDGVDDGDTVISNGIADWVYEEEMLLSSNAMWFGNDGNTLAYLKFDDTLVEKFQFPKYGNPGEMTYPNWVELRYPKAGSQNPTVTLHVIPDLATSIESITFTYTTAPPVENYIATVKWLTDDTLLVIHLNRPQTQAIYYVCTLAVPPAQGTCIPAYTDAPTNGWIDPYTPRVSADGQFLLTVAPVTVAEGVTYKQIVRIDLDTGTVKEVTKERFAVNSILGWLEGTTTDKVYFTATGLHYDAEGQPITTPSSTHIYTVDIIDDGATQNATRLTRDLANSDNVTCEANSGSFSTGFTHWIHNCGGPGIPEVMIRNNDVNSTIIETVQDNSNLRTLLRPVGLPKQLQYSIPIPETDFAITVRLFVPPDFNENSGIKYPLLIDVYGGPGSQAIGNGFRIDWGTSLVTDKKIIYGLIDGRGSGGQTQELLNLVYRRLGTFEIDDQINAVQWLIDNYNFIDANRTGIWGWSYGGFASSMALALDINDVFKCGIAVAPVTSWRYYDTIYTERFMGVPTPEDNEDGYNRGQVTTRAKGFEGKEFLLVHGNADDNVHYQQSMILARALEYEDVLFDQLSYPDENHGISGPKAHLYHSFERFLFRNCLKQEVPSNDENTNSSSRMGTWFALTVMSLLAIWSTSVLL